MVESNDLKEPMWVRIVSGSLGSVLTALVVTPLEVVKIRQQFHSPGVRPQAPIAALPPNVSPCPSCGVFVFNNGLRECILPRSAVPFFDHKTGKIKEDMLVTRSRGTFAMLRNIWLTEGSAGIYAGLRPTLVMGIPNTVLYFTSYEELKERMNKSPTQSIPESIIPAIAGASARVLASVSTAPLELIRTQQAAQVGGGQAAGGLWMEFQTIIQTQGFLSLYRGLSPTLFRDIPFSAVYWYSIEKLRASWGDSSGSISALEQGERAVFNGTVAGIIAAAVTTPLDVVKTRRQVASEPAIYTADVCDHQGALAYGSKSGTKPAPTGTVATLNKIMKEEGVAGLWRGNQARMIKVAPACAIMLSSYEIGKRLLSES